MYPPKAVQDAIKQPQAATAPPALSFQMPGQVKDAIAKQGGDPADFERRMQKALSSKDPQTVKSALGAYGQFIDAHTDIRQPSYYSLLSPGSELSQADQLNLSAWDDFKNSALNAFTQTKKGMRDAGSTIGSLVGLVPDLEKALNANRQIQDLQTLAITSAGSKDMFEDFNLNSFAATMGQGFGQVAASIAPMAAGALVGGPVGIAAGRAAGVLVSSTQMYGQLLDDFRAKGVPIQDATLYAGGLSAILGVVETFLPMDKLVDKFASPLISKTVLDPIVTKIATNGITKETMGEIEKAVFSSGRQKLQSKLATAATNIGNQAALEGIEEFSQGYIEDAGKKLYDYINNDDKFKDIDFGSYKNFIDHFQDGIVGAMIGGTLGAGVMSKSLNNQTLYPYLDKGIANGTLDKRIENLTTHADFLVSKGRITPEVRNQFIKDVQDVAGLAGQVRSWTSPATDPQTRFDLFQLNRLRQDYLEQAQSLNEEAQTLTQQSLNLHPFEKGAATKKVAANDTLLRFLNDATGFIDTELSDLGAGTKSFDRNVFNLGLQDLYTKYYGTDPTTSNNAQSQTAQTADVSNLSDGNQNQMGMETQANLPESGSPVNVPDSQGALQSTTQTQGDNGSIENTGQATGPNTELSNGNAQGMASDGTTPVNVADSRQPERKLTTAEKALAVAEERAQQAKKADDAAKKVSAIEKENQGFFEFAKGRLGVKNTKQLAQKIVSNPDEVNALLEEFIQNKDAEEEQYRRAHNDFVDRIDEYNEFIKDNKFKAKKGKYSEDEEKKRNWIQSNAPTFGVAVEFSKNGVKAVDVTGEKVTRFGIFKDPATFLKAEDLTPEEYSNFNNYIAPHLADYYEEFVNKDAQQFQFNFSINGIVKNGSVAEGIRAAVEDIQDGVNSRRADGLLTFVRLATNQDGLPIWVVRTAKTQQKGTIPWDTLVQKEAEDFFEDAEIEPYNNFVLDFLSSEEWNDTDREIILQAFEEYLDTTEGYPTFDYLAYELDKDLGDETLFQGLSPQAADALRNLFDQMAIWTKEVEEYNANPSVFPPKNTFDYANEQRGSQQSLPRSQQTTQSPSQGDVPLGNQSQTGTENTDPNEPTKTNPNGPSESASPNGENTATAEGELRQNEVVQAQVANTPTTTPNPKVVAFANEIGTVFPNIDLITDPAEIDAVIEQHPNEFVPITSQGQLLGFNFRGKVYVDPRVATPETAIHEFGHIWADVAEKEFPAHLERGLSLIRGTEYEARVREMYPWLVNNNPLAKGFDWLTNDRQLLKEALVQAIGEKGVAIQNQSVLARFSKWLGRLMRDAAEYLGFEFDADTRLDDFLTEAALDLTSGKPLSTISSAQLAEMQTTPQAQMSGNYQASVVGQRATPRQLADNRIFLQGKLKETKGLLSESNKRKKTLNNRNKTLDGRINAYSKIINDKNSSLALIKSIATKLTKANAAKQAIEAELETIKTNIKAINAYIQNIEGEIDNIEKVVKSSMILVDENGNAFYEVVDPNALGNEMQQVAQERDIKQSQAGPVLGKLHKAIFSGSALNPFVRTFEPHIIADYLFKKGSAAHRVMGETVRALSKKVGPIRVKGHDVMLAMTTQFRDICTFRGIASPDTMKSKGLVEAVTTTDGTVVEIPHDYLVTMVATYKTQMQEYQASSMVEGEGTLLQDWRDPEKRIKVKLDANEMLRLEALVDAQYGDLLQQTQDYFQAVLPSLQETYLNLEAKDLPLANADFYFPIRYESELKEAMSTSDNTLSRDAPFVKERKGINDKDLIVTQSVFELMNRYMRGTENYIQLIPSSQNFNLIKTLTTPYMERNGLMGYNKELERMAVKFNNPMSDFEGGGRSVGVRVFKKIMGLTTLSRFGFNVALPLKNITGYSGALGQGIVDDKHLRANFGFVTSAIGNGYARLFKSIPTNRGELQNPSTINNPQSQAIQSTIAEMYANPDAGPILSRVLNDGMPDLNTLEWATISAVSENNTVRTALRRYNQAIGILKESGLTAQQQADSSVMLGFWRAATDHVRENMANESFEVQQKEIARLANELMYATNATYDLTDKSSLQLDGRWWTKMIIMYQSQGFKVFNTMVKSINDYIMDPTPEKKKIMLVNVRHTMIYAPIYIAMVNIFASGLRALGDDDKEEQIFSYDNALWEIAGQLSQVLPVANVGTEFIVSAIDNRPWASPMATLDPLEPINKGGQGLLEAISLSLQDFEDLQDQREADKKIKQGFISATTELPTALGVPRELIRLVNKYGVSPLFEE